MRLTELKRELQDPAVFKRRLAEARQHPVSAREAAKWLNVPARRCPSCLMANPAACSRCLTCDAIYRGETVVCDAPQQADVEPVFRSTYIQVGTQAWDLDDEAVVPWTVKLPRISPKKHDNSLSVQPPFHLRNLQGMRNRIDCIDSFQWAKTARRDYEYMYEHAIECP